MFEYGQQTDIHGNIIHEGSWGLKSSPAVSIPIMIENFRAIKDDGIAKVSAVQLDEIKAWAKAYTDNSQALILGGAPALTDTLYELSNALGNNPNFSTDIVDLIGTKASTIHSHTWGQIAGMPTTLAGYGITDVYAKIDSDKKYAPIHNPIFTGRLGVGSTSPRATLDVIGNLLLDGAISGENSIASFNNTDYTAGTKTFLRIRQQASEKASYTAFLGVDRDTRNVFLSNDDITKQHLAITPEGTVIIDKLKADNPHFTGYVNTSFGMGFTNNNKQRWSMYLDGTPETGLNTGTDLSLARYNDSGDFIANAFSISRNNGNIGVGTQPKARLHSSCDVTTYQGSMTYAGAFGVGGKATLIGYDVSIGAGVIASSTMGVSWDSLVINPNGKGLGIGGVISPQATLHSMGSTIIGISGISNSTLGNLQMSIGVDTACSTLYFNLKDALGNIKTLGFTLPTSGLRTI